MASQPALRRLLLLGAPLAVAGGFALVHFAASPAAAAADPSTCAGYAEARQFVDAQSWWTTTPGKGGSDFGHVHVGGCIPERETLTGTVPLDIRVVLHNNPGKLLPVSVVVKTTASETTIAKLAVPSGFSCPVGTCVLWLHYDLNTASFDRSGLQEIRYRAFVDEPDGKRMIASLNYQVNVSNGKTASNVTRLPYPRGKGWYTGAGYCEARMLTVPLPDAPISSWSPRVWSRWHGTTADLSVTGHDIRLDADFHAGIPGKILRQGAGEFEGTVSTGALAPGTHKLSIRSDCADPRGSTNSGVLVITVTS